MSDNRIDTIIAIGTLIVLIGCTAAFWLLMHVLLG